MPIRQSKQWGVGRHGQEARGQKEGEEPVEDEQVHGGAGFAAAGSHFALEKDVLPDV